MITNEPMKPSLETIKSFAERNVVAATVETLACGDGRYTKDQNPGGLRMFGGDMGALAAYWQAGKKAGRFTSHKDIATCIRDYKEAKVKVLKGYEITGPGADTLYFHTDSHGDEINGKYGCGHMKNLTNGVHKEDYDAEGEDMEALFAYVRDPKNEINHVVTKLEGVHAEGAVILVKGEGNTVPNHTVRSLDPETGDMNFVVDIDRVKEFFNRMSTALHQSNISADELMGAYIRQQNVTAGILAPNMQMAQVFIDGAGRVTRVEDAGTVAPIA